MSNLSEFEFKDFIPPVLYTRYFDSITGDKNVYICIIQNESQVGAVYLEKTLKEEGREDVEGAIRVFFNPEDLTRYGKHVAYAEEVPFEFVRRWEMKFSAFIDYVSQMDAKYKETGRLGVRAIASAIHDEKFVELDVLWTSDTSLMV
jgi:hypothetical protein